MTRVIETSWLDGQETLNSDEGRLEGRILREDPGLPLHKNDIVAPDANNESIRNSL
jgi:hypothetical protein